MRNRRVAAAVAATLALAACGGGNGGGDQLTAEEFREQADAICVEFEGRLNDLGEPQSLDDLQQYVDDAVPIIEEGNAELEELEPPDELADQWERALDFNREQLETVRELQTAVEEGDQAAVAELLQQAESVNQQADQLAADLGLQECGT